MALALRASSRALLRPNRLPADLSNPSRFVHPLPATRNEKTPDGAFSFLAVRGVMGEPVSATVKPGFAVFTEICRDFFPFWCRTPGINLIIGNRFSGLPGNALFAPRKNRELQGKLLAPAVLPSRSSKAALGDADEDTKPLKHPKKACGARLKMAIESSQRSYCEAQPRGRDDGT